MNSGVPTRTKLVDFIYGGLFYFALNKAQAIGTFILKLNHIMGMKL